MHTLKCPHCENEIELLNQKDLAAQYRLTPNKVVRLLKNGSLTEPVLDFGNNRLWTRQQIDTLRTEQSKERVQTLLVDTEEALTALPEGERALFLEALLGKAKEQERKRA